MPNSWFQFRQFTVQQENSAMKVGTDGVLLGAWASVPYPVGSVLDIGTGTGLIALMIAQRTRDVKIDALEIDDISAMQAEENFRNSPWKERLQCIPSSFQEYVSRCRDRYDLIICNPPYFSDSKKAPAYERNLARHDDTLSLQDIFKGSVSLIKERGILSMILPVQKEEQALDLISDCSLYCNRITRIKPIPAKPCNRVLIESSCLPGKPEEQLLTIETGKRHVYSDEFKKLIQEFYL
jgi:tRNA1Val (adenine37-N6)-methyltransferase